MSVAARPIAAIAALGVVLVVAACSASFAGYPIATGICNACRGKAFTAEECAAFGRAAGCLTVEVVDPSIEGCSNACSFEHCKNDISCGSSTGGRPGGPGGPPEPCGVNVGGIFADPPACNEAKEVTVDGVTAYVCLCEAGCPCGLGCGVIAQVDPNAPIYCTTP